MCAINVFYSEGFGPDICKHDPFYSRNYHALLNDVPSVLAMSGDIIE